jgi:hypothetical protein
MLDDLKRAAAGSVLETQPHYRTAIGVLGVLLPPILVVGGLLRGVAVQGSISAYYHHNAMRDWFVGILWVIGVFLFFYQYAPRDIDSARSSIKAVRIGTFDAWLGKAAGVAALIVAMFPTTPPPESPVQPPTIGMIHGAAAALLFVCLSLFPLLLFSQSRDWARTYVMYGALMLGVVALIVAYQFAPEDWRLAIADLRPLLVLEWALIWLFGASWFHKGRELAAKPATLRAVKRAS